MSLWRILSLARLRSAPRLCTWPSRRWAARAGPGMSLRGILFLLRSTGPRRGSRLAATFTREAASGHLAVAVVQAAGSESHPNTAQESRGEGFTCQSSQHNTLLLPSGREWA